MANNLMPYNKKDTLFPWDDLVKQAPYPIDPESTNPQKQIMSKPQIPAPPSPPNGGIFGGPQSTAPWANIPVTPDMHVLITQNLASANPPPGAMKQMVGTNRLGNNTIVQPPVGWFQPPMTPYLQKSSQPGHDGDPDTF